MRTLARLLRELKPTRAISALAAAISAAKGSAQCCRTLLKVNPSTRREGNPEQAPIYWGASKLEGRTLHDTRAMFGLETLVSVSGVVHGLNDARIPWIKLNLLAQLRDVLIKRAAVRHVVQTPAFVEDGIPVEHLAAVPVKKRENLYVTRPEIDGCLFPAGPEKFLAVWDDDRGGVYAAASIDGGKSWGKNVKLAEKSRVGITPLDVAVDASSGTFYLVIGDVAEGSGDAVYFVKGKIEP